MTLILALRCNDGVVLASDSQATLATSGQQTRDDVDKLYLIGGHLGWGGSGSGGLIQRVQEKLAADHQGLSKTFERDGVEAGARRLFAIVNTLQREAIQAFVPVPGLPPAAAEHVTGLFTGISRGHPFMLEVGVHGSRHIPKAYSAIGSGDLFATHAMGCVAHYNVAGLSLERAMALAYRTVNDAIKSAAFGIGGPVQLLTATPEETRCLSPEEIEPIRDLVDLWKQQEAEVLGKLSRSPDATEPTQDPPTEDDSE